MIRRTQLRALRRDSSQSDVHGMRDVSQTQCKEAERSECQSTSKSDAKREDMIHERERESRERQPTKRCQKCLKHERERLSSKAPPDDLQPACMPERECHQNTRREVACGSDKRKLMWQNAHMKHFQSEKPGDRETRIDGHPAMPDDPTDHAVAQTTQCCWRPLTNCSGKVSHRPERSRRRSLICYCCPESEAAMKIFTMRVDTVREPRDT